MSDNVIQTTGLGVVVQRASLALALLGACDAVGTPASEGTGAGGKADDAGQNCDDGDPKCARDDGFSHVGGAALDAMAAFDEDRFVVWNYGDNAELCRLIADGARGAYWDILARTAGD